MIRVVVAEKGGESKALRFEKSEITIGRVVGNDVILPRGNVSARHARIANTDGNIILVDLRSTNGTYLNGRKLTSPMPVRELDRIYIGDFSLWIEANPEDQIETLDVDPTELQLLAAIVHHEEGSRIVYADWLEVHGDLARAEFLRAQDKLVSISRSSPAFAPLDERVRALAAGIDLRWRQKVARPAIENCVEFDFECPNEWGALATTERSDVRYCEACKRRVFYCASVFEARDRAGRGECVAVDLVNVRRRGDLEPDRPMVMGAVAID